MKAHAGVDMFRVLGERMLAPYHRPEGPEGRRFPLVLFLHGFPGAEKSVDVQRELMARGIATLAPHFLGSWGSGGTYRFTTLAAQAHAALKAGRKLSFVDPRRVAVYGFSMGGWTALQLAAAEPTLKAVAAVAPVGGAAEMITPERMRRLAHLGRTLNAPPASVLARDLAAALRAGDPAEAAARGRFPLLLVHGDKDALVPVGASRRVAKAAGGPAKLVVERGAGHDFLDRRPKLAKLCASWLSKFLLGALLAVPAAAQDLERALGAAAALAAGARPRPKAQADAKTPEQAVAALSAALRGRADAAAFLADPRLAVLDGVVERFPVTPPGGKPPPPTPYDEYKKLFINPSSLAAGEAFLKARAAELAAAEAAGGVDRWLLAAIAGVETRYGTWTGQTPTGSALWTIALKVRARSDWAVKELAELLVFAKAEGLDAHALKGSYAGAFGFTQFMPSSANAYAVDGDADGDRDLFTWPDALGSSASFLKANGYKAGDPFTPGSSVGRAVWAYNHSSNYVRVVLELRGELKARDR